MMQILSFDDLLQEAVRQKNPQRLLFVFTAKGSPDNPSDKEQEGFQTGTGGTLTPVICVDKPVDEVSSFGYIVKESEATGQGWDVVFVACMDEKRGGTPDAKAVSKGLDTMIEAIKTANRLERFLAFDRSGTLLQITI